MALLDLPEPVDLKEQERATQPPSRIRRWAAGGSEDALVKNRPIGFVAIPMSAQKHPTRAQATVTHRILPDSHGPNLVSDKGALRVRLDVLVVTSVDAWNPHPLRTVLVDREVDAAAVLDSKFSGRRLGVLEGAAEELVDWPVDCLAVLGAVGAVLASAAAFIGRFVADDAVLGLDANELGLFRRVDVVIDVGKGVDIHLG